MSDFENFLRDLELEMEVVYNLAPKTSKNKQGKDPGVVSVAMHSLDHAGSKSKDGEVVC